jgi:hypothetical protein
VRVNLRLSLSILACSKLVVRAGITEPLHHSVQTVSETYADSYLIGTRDSSFEDKATEP